MVKKFILTCLPYLIIIGIVSLFFWKVFVKGYIPFPGDLLVGAYLPWIENHWGYAVHVPVKNPLISDVFSQLYLWKILVTESYKHGTIPLWNPYSYSGYPLLANFQSGVLNIGNITFLLLGAMKGWSAYTILSLIGAASSMYLYLRTLRYTSPSALIGALAYGLSGYAMVWVLFATAVYAMIWIPLLLLVIEKSFQNRRPTFLLFLAPLLFLLVTAGHFQNLTYGVILTLAYFIWHLLRTPQINRQRYLLIFLGVMLLGLGLSAIQLLPTLELTSQSVRFADKRLEEFNYGLIPLAQLVTLFAPDFFGHPVTYNYWGSINYNETIFYTGILGLMAFIAAIFRYKESSTIRFFLALAFIAIVLGYDTPVARLVYLLKLPFISTSGGGRISFLFTFAGGVLIADFIENIKPRRLGDIIRWFWAIPFWIMTVFGIIICTSVYFKNMQPYSTEFLTNLHIAFRNMIIPCFIFIAFLGTLLIRKWKFFYVIVMIVLLFDLFRFGWKYLPITSTDYVFPKTTATDFLTAQPGIFRVDREKAEVMPPNTWTAYSLMSPSGYDPVALKSYVEAYEKQLNHKNIPTISRSSELERYDATALGNYNVKYLLAIKRDKDLKYPGNNVITSINPLEWERVFETQSVAILKNTKYQERVGLYNRDGKSASGSATIQSYTASQIIIDYQNSDADFLVLRDSWYPGWKAFVNQKPVLIEKYNHVFRQVSIPNGSGTVTFSYQPISFQIGLYLSVSSALLWLALLSRFGLHR